MYLQHYNTIILKGRFEPSIVVDTPYGPYLTGWMCVPRDSGTVDVLPVRMPPDMLRDVESCADAEGRIVIKGTIRQCNEDDRSLLWVAAHQIKPPMDYYFDNEVRMRGELCKPPVFRLSPSGFEICDMILASRRNNGKADYVPILTRSGSARLTAQYGRGDCLDVRGRFQSREYVKRRPDGQEERRVAYEVSVSDHRRMFLGRERRA